MQFSDIYSELIGYFPCSKGCLRHVFVLGALLVLSSLALGSPALLQSEGMSFDRFLAVDARATENCMYVYPISCKSRLVTVDYGEVSRD